MRMSYAFLGPAGKQNPRLRKALGVLVGSNLLPVAKAYSNIDGLQASIWNPSDAPKWCVRTIQITLGGVFDMAKAKTRKPAKKASTTGSARMFNDKAYAAIQRKYPILTEKSKATALCVWAYDANKDCTTDEIRDLAKAVKIKVAGRALGSARAIVGFKPLTPVKPKAGKGRVGRPRRVVAKKSAGLSFGGGDPLTELVQMAKRMEAERETMHLTLVKLRDLIDRALVD